MLFLRQRLESCSLAPASTKLFCACVHLCSTVVKVVIAAKHVRGSVLCYFNNAMRDLSLLLLLLDVQIALQDAQWKLCTFVERALWIRDNVLCVQIVQSQLDILEI